MLCISRFLRNIRLCRRRWARRVCRRYCWLCGSRCRICGRLFLRHLRRYIVWILRATVTTTSRNPCMLLFSDISANIAGIVTGATMSMSAQLHYFSAGAFLPVLLGVCDPLFSTMDMSRSRNQNHLTYSTDLWFRFCSYRAWSMLRKIPHLATVHTFMAVPFLIQHPSLIEIMLLRVLW